MQKERNVGLDLLRIVSMLMIVTLHYLDKGGALWQTERNTFLWYFIWLLRALCLVSVNCYVLISAYFLTSSKEIKLIKIVELLTEMWTYSIGILFIFFLVGVPISVSDIIYACFPFITKRYWFINTYILMYLLHPFLNKIIWNINKKEFKRLLIILIMFFSFEQSILPLPEMTLDATGGYGILWFVVLYFTAAYIKRFGTKRGLPSKKNCLLVFIGGGLYF